MSALPAPGLFASQVEALARTPGILAGLTEAYRWFAEEGTVPRKYHELSIVVVSSLNRCRYCVSHHTPFLLACGASEAQLATVHAGAWRERTDLFDEVERTVLEWAETVTLTPWAKPPALLARLKTHFTEAQVVELTARTALCSFWNKFNDALDLALEPGIPVVATPGLA